MVSIKFEDMSSEVLSQVLMNGEKFLGSGFNEILPELEPIQLVGSVFKGSPHTEREAVEVAVNRLGKKHTVFSWKYEDTPSTDELLMRLKMISETVDFLLTSYVDNDTFSEGRILTTKLSEYNSAPSFSIRDDIYANLSGLSILLGLNHRLGLLRGKRIAIVWVFGSQFASPSLGHSILSLGSKTGAQMSIVAPDEFSLLSRVVRKSEKEGAVDIVSSMGDTLKGFDAIVPINWYRFEDFSYPERNMKTASEFKDWYVDEEKVATDTLVITEPPNQMDVSISKGILQRDTNLTNAWYNLVTAALTSTMEFVTTESKAASAPVFLY